MNGQTFHVQGPKDNIKMAILLKLTYRFKAIPNKILVDFLVKIDKLILKFTWKSKGPKIIKTILEKKKLED